MRQRQGSATAIAIAGDDRHFAHHEQDDSGSRRAQCEAHTDFARALLGGVRQHAVEADRRQQQSQSRKADGEKRKSALLGCAVVDLLFHGAQAVDDQCGIKLVNGLADRSLAPFPAAGRVRR